MGDDEHQRRQQQQSGEPRPKVATGPKNRGIGLTRRPRLRPVLRIEGCPRHLTLVLTKNGGGHAMKQHVEALADLPPRSRASLAMPLSLILPGQPPTVGRQSMRAKYPSSSKCMSSLP